MKLVKGSFEKLSVITIKAKRKVRDFQKRSNKEILQQTFQICISWPNFMDGREPYSSPNIWRKFLLIYLTNAIMVIPLNLAIDITRNAQNIMCPRYKEPRWVWLLFFLLLQAVQNCSRLHKWTNIIDMNYAN